MNNIKFMVRFVESLSLVVSRIYIGGQIKN